MPGRQEISAVAVTAPAVVSGRSQTARVLLPRIAAVAVLVAAVGVIAALAGYARGRGSVDQDALRAQAYAAGRTAAAAKAAPAARPASSAVHTASASSPSLHLAPSRAEVTRAFDAGRRQGLRDASFAQRAHGRALGAAAALGGFPAGWSLGRWYIVRMAPGDSLTAGGPRIAQRVGPLAPGEAYSACRGGRTVCQSAAGQ